MSKLYYTVSDIAEILGWEYKRTYRWLTREKVLVVRAGRLVTTRDALVKAFPEVWHRIAETQGDPG